MIAVVSRVSSASVVVSEETVADTRRGFLVLLGVVEGDKEADAEYLAGKITALRVFEDDAAKMNLSITDIGGAMTVVSNFTLAADTRRGNRPSFSNAAEPVEANSLYEFFCEKCRAVVCDVQTGVFRADMEVSSVGDGPVTIIIDSAQRNQPRRKD